MRDKRAKAKILIRIARLANGNPGDVTPVGEGISELRINFGPGYRVYYVQRGAKYVLLLAGGDKSRQAKDIALAKRLAGEYEEETMAPTVKKSAKPFDAAKYLDSDEAVAEYISEALLTGDIDTITHAIGVAAKARGMSEIARQTGLSRESLYKALSGEGHPQFETISLVLRALGLRLRVEPASDSPNERAA